MDKLQNWQLVEQWFRDNPHPDGPALLRNWVVDMFWSGNTTREVIKTLRREYDFPFNRDALEMWARHFKVRAAEDADNAAEDFVPDPADYYPAETPSDRVTAHREKAEQQAMLKELRDATTHAARKEAYLEAVRDVAPQILRGPELMELPALEGKPTHEWVLLLSDIQLGQRTTLRETGGLFEQNTEIVAWQFQKLFEVIVRLHDIARQSKNISTLHIVLNGDLVEGDSMRSSQAAKVDRIVTEQTMEAVNFIEDLMFSLLQFFPRIILYVCPGNHDRTTQKGDTAGLGESGGAVQTYAWLLGKILERTFKADERVEVRVAEAFVQAALICGKKFVWEHGASIPTGNSYAGVPLHGIVSAAQKFDRMFGGLDYLLLSHFHQAAVLPIYGGQVTCVMNGAWPPSSDYVQQKIKVVGRPQQWLMDVHPKYGVTEYHPLFIGHPSHELSVTYWESLRTQ